MRNQGRFVKPALGLVVSAGLAWILAATLALAGTESGNETRKMNIQEIRSPGGIVAWLVEEHSVPLVSLRFAFAGGSAQNPEGKEGVANFLTAMLDEGAGDLKSAEFQERMEDLAMRLSFSEGRDFLYGSFQSLSENLDETTELLRLAISEPRFDADAHERIRKQLAASLAFAAKNPNRVAGRKWSEAAFPGHPYGRPTSGTAESLAAITPDDLRAYRERVFAKSNLTVAVVGDIDAAALGGLLDRIFGGLGEKPDLATVKRTDPAGAKLIVADMPVPQSVAVFGFKGIGRDDADFVPAYVMNHILGGGGFASRLMEEVREKRGLAYSVYSYLQPYDNAAVFLGRVATQNEKLAESLEVIRGEIRRMATDGPSAADLESAKSYLTGSYALRFDTNSKIASQLLAIQRDKLGIDYVNKRNDMIKAVTLDDIKRVAGRILKPDNLIVSVAGRPKDLHPNN